MESVFSVFPSSETKTLDIEKIDEQQWMDITGKGYTSCNLIHYFTPPTQQRYLTQAAVVHPRSLLEPMRSRATSDTCSAGTLVKVGHAVRLASSTSSESHHSRLRKVLFGGAPPGGYSRRTSCSQAAQSSPGRSRSPQLKPRLAEDRANRAGTRGQPPAAGGTAPRTSSSHVPEQAVQHAQLRDHCRRAASQHRRDSGQHRLGQGLDRCDSTGAAPAVVAF